MATFNYTVDTRPMAQEIGSVSNHVRATTTAVVAMQAAVISAETQAADHVCENVNRGFYTLIRSQISQKMARLKSNVDSHFMQLVQQRKQLLAIKGRMERDYNMISTRYLKLFNGLNANLKHRVFELDKPVIDFAVKEVEKVSNRTKYLTATIPVNQLESLAASQKIVASNIKYRGLNVINSMTKFLGDMYAQKKLTDKILLELNFNVENSTLSIPIVISEFNYDKYDTKHVEINVSSIVLNSQSQTALKNSLMPIVEILQWQNDSADNKEIQGEFSKLFLTSNASQRIKDMTSKLFFASSFQTIKY